VPYNNGLTHVVCCVLWPQLGETPVHAAALKDNPKCIEVVIAAKADLNIPNNVSGRG